MGGRYLLYEDEDVRLLRRDSTVIVKVKQTGRYLEVDNRLITMQGVVGV